MNNTQKTLTNEAIKAEKREYFRNWRKNNPEKVKAAQERYWRRKLEIRVSASDQTR